MRRRSNRSSACSIACFKRLDKAEAKTVARLDELLETIVGKPTVEVSLQIGGRLITSTAELDRLLEEIRLQIVHQLDANHRVRLR
jgi:hypothetical protein